jgi:hypothetical protein
MPTVMTCPCGRRLRVPDEAAGKRARCPACGRLVNVPRPSDSAVGEGSAPLPYAAAPAAAGQTYWHVLLLLALVPLAVFTFKGGPPQTFKEQLHATLAAHPEVKPKLDELLDEAREGHVETGKLLDDLFDLLPGHRMQGALLPYGSYMHWLFALISAAAFLGLGLLMFPGQAGPPKRLLAVGAFTGTIGIMFLLGVQWVAFQSQGIWLRGTGVIVLIFYIVKFIGFSYQAALGDTGFVLSFLGFICGVGFCEEVCKVLPLAWWSVRHGLDSWRTACVWGMVSGFGFGVSEAITYAGGHYNGIDSGGIYLV